MKPCWPNYRQLGMKMKKGKKVPNCIPIKELTIGPKMAVKLLEYCKRNKDKVNEAEYQGRDVTLNKPMRGDVKKFKVYVKDPQSGNIVKVNFGDKNMEIKRDNPENRKNFRSRHNCSDKTDKTKAGYWSCKMWSGKKVSDIV